MKTAEDLLRENVRELISLVKKKNKNTQSEEQQLRAIIREFLRHELKEAAVADNDPAPHKSTGINVLEDLLKKIIPQIEDDYKLLTTSEEQRESYRAHIIDAVVKTLTPVDLNNDAPEQLPDNAGLEEEVDVQISDDDEEDEMFIDINPEEPEEEEEEQDPRDVFGIEGKDTTGRNMAYTTFKKIESQIIDAYDMLSNPEDQELFFDYLIANLKLYFDKFEAEIQPDVPEPTNKEYDSAKGEPAADAGDEGGETLDLEI
jgi:hypothetical protein